MPRGPAGEKAAEPAGCCPTSPRNTIFELDRTTIREPEGGTSHRLSTCPISSSNSITDLNEKKPVHESADGIVPTTSTRDLGGEKVPHAVTNDVFGGIAQPSPSTIVISQAVPNPFPDFSPHLASSISECPPPEMLTELTTSTEECCCSMEECCSFMGGIILFLLWWKIAATAATASTAPVLLAVMVGPTLLLLVPIVSPGEKIQDVRTEASSCVCGQLIEPIINSRMAMDSSTTASTLFAVNRCLDLVAREGDG